MIKNINGRLMLSLGTLFLTSHYLFASFQCLSTPLSSPFLSSPLNSVPSKESYTPPLVDLQEKIIFIVWGLFLSLGTNPIDLPLPFA
jgi:hypothetical protein